MNVPAPGQSNAVPCCADTARSEQRLATVREIVREISQHTDPQTMVSFFRKRARVLYGGEASMSLSRRGLEAPAFRITRATRWREEINPWLEPERLPLLRGGLLGELAYSDEPRVLRDVCVPASDPAHDYLRDVGALVSLPLFDDGVALNTVVRLARDPDGFDGLNLADALLTANLFGRSTAAMVTARRLEQAHAEIDHELRRVARIQRSLLPARLPSIPGLDIAVSYETAARAGGDYYDFFELGDGRWGMLIADVSGHGTPAAVVMAMLRTMLHGQCVECVTPGELLTRVNRQLCDRAGPDDGTFVTAWYGVYDAAERSLRYACAGHNPPLLVDPRPCVCELNDAHGFPLAVHANGVFAEGTARLSPGDTLLLYTDGITESFNEAGEAYGHERLLECAGENVPNAQHIIDCVTHKLIAFTGGGRQEDDRTLLAMRVR